jgi:hypothetical protein
MSENNEIDCDCGGCPVIEGCFNTRGIDKEYTEYYDEKMEICPCRICIVKAMCGDACDLYEQIWN